MRVDTAAFAAKNLALQKRPRYVVELAFDSDNSILWYFTSHDDAALPPGASAIPGVIEGLSGTSQTLNPDTANASIGAISFSVVDRGRVVTETLGAELVLGRSTRRQRVRVYVGFEGLEWDDYTLVQTQLVTEIAYDEGVYKFTCADVQREMRKDLFELARTTLASTVSADASVIEVFSTGGFSMVEHGSSYSDAPGQTVGYLTLEKECIRYTGMTPTSFTGCARGVLNTRAVQHVADPAAAADRRLAVEEYVYLELPAVDLMYRLLTGKDRLGNAVMPAAWHLGVPLSYVRLADFTGIGADLWDTSDDSLGFVVRFEALEKTDGKKFIETELALLTGLFMPVYADGALGLRRMSNVLAGAAHVALLDGDNLVSVDALRHDFNALRNVLQISWNWEPDQEAFTRTNLLVDAGSISTHGRAETLKLKFRGLHGSRHSATILAQRFDALRDRYTNPPLRMKVVAMPRLNTLEVSDVVRARPPGVRDFVLNGDLDRSFEIQNISMDWITGALGFSLFASSGAPGEIPPTADETVLSDAWYTSAGTALSSVVTISGSNPGHVTAGGTLTGVAGDLNASGSIFYYDGDLVIDPGVTINIANGAQLRVRGFLQNNGRINGKGLGIAAGGTPGFLGNTQAGGGLRMFLDLRRSMLESQPAPVVAGAYGVVPAFNLAWDGTSLTGLPSDLRGTSGGSGLPLLSQFFPVATFAGGNGGAGGSGLIIVSRGYAAGVAGVIDLSGNDGSAVAAVSGIHPLTGLNYRPGSGAGGSSGGLLLVLDGSAAIATGLTEAGFVAMQGRTPWFSSDIEGPIFRLTSEQGSYYSWYQGTGDDTNFPRPNLSGARGGARVQYVPGGDAAEPDAPAFTLTAPTNLGLESGSSDLLLQSDGTVVPRVKVTWTPSTDPRVLGYDIQFKLSAVSIWSSIPPVLEGSTDTAWIIGAGDGANIDVRIRAAGAARQISDWVEITDFFVIGKTALPADVTGFSASQNGNVVVFQWNQVADVDLAGYEIRYGPPGIAWADATPLTKVTRGTSVTSAAVPPSPVLNPWTMMIKARDTSGNYSDTEASTELDVQSTFSVIYQQQQAPDWLGTLSNFAKSWDGVLIHESTLLANQHTNEELFEQRVPYPEPVATYTAPEIDIGFDETARIWGSIDAALLPGGAGVANPALHIDFRTAAGSYDGFEPWTIGDREGRYFQHRIVSDAAEGTIKITGFLPTVDLEERVETRQVVIAPGGSTVTFVDQYHNAPHTQATVVGTGGLIPNVSAVTSTQFTAHVYDTSGTSVGGTINYTATGV